MICKHCGCQIDTSKRKSDGSIQCPKCKVVYRPRPKAKPQAKKRTSFVEWLKSIPWKKKIWKLPLWLWVVIVVVVIGLCGSKDGNNVNSTQNIYATPVPTGEATIPETAPTDAPYAESDQYDWAVKFEQTEAEVAEYVTDKMREVCEISNIALDYHQNEPDVYDVSFDAFAGVSDSEIKATIKYIEETLTDYKFNFWIQFRKDEYSVRFMVAFGEGFDGYSTSGKSYATLEELFIPPEE